MLCSRCGKKQAVMQVSNVHNGVKNVEYICADCGNQLLNSNLSFNIGNPWDIMSKFMENMAAPGLVSHGHDTTCPTCGTTFREFTARGRLGCGDCYDAFKDGLIPILDDLHFSHEYKGKMPQSPGLLENEDKLAILDKEKKEAVAREDYERAAQLQKEIRELKKRMEGEK